MENVKVIIWGLGAMGGGMADMLLKKKGVDRHRRRPTNVGEEAEGRPGADEEDRPLSVGDSGVVVGVAARQGIGHGVKMAGEILDGEVEAEELADPLMLQHGGEALVQQKLEAVVVRADTDQPPL